MKSYLRKCDNVAMFLRQNKRRKNGKLHRYFSVVENQRGNIAFAYLATKCPPPFFYGITPEWYAYNVDGEGGGTYGGYWAPKNMGKFARTPRSDNLAAFAVGRALAQSKTLDEQALQKVLFGPTDKYKTLNKSVEPGKLTWIPEYGDDGFDTNTLKPNKVPYDGPSSLKFSKQLRARWVPDRPNTDLPTWANRWYEDYWGPGVPN